MAFIRNFLILAAGVFLATLIVPGLGTDLSSVVWADYNWNALLLVILILALFNSVIKPVLVFFALPFIFVTLGIGLLFINALLLYWAARLVHFPITSFWSALGGALVISFTNMMLSGIARRHGPRRPRSDPPPPPSAPRNDGGGEVIDV